MLLTADASPGCSTIGAGEAAFQGEENFHRGRSISIWCRRRSEGGVDCAGG
jgi:hypothetical protein